MDISFAPSGLAIVMDSYRRLTPPYVFSGLLYFLSPKGSNSPAQGNALGAKAQFAKALKGRYMPAGFIWPFQGYNNNVR